MCCICFKLKKISQKDTKSIFFFLFLPETLTDPAAEAVQETQQPSCLPLSSVLRFFSPGVPRATPRKHPLSNKSSGGPLAKVAKLSHTKTASKHTNGKSPPSSLGTNAPNSMHLSSLLLSSSKVSWL